MQIAYLIDHAVHVSELARLHFQEWSYLRQGESLEGRTARLLACCGRNAIPTVVVALEAEQLLGSALLVAQDLESRPHLTPWLAGVFVKAQHRGRGIGTRLIQRIEAEARWLGTTNLYLYTSSTQTLYQRLGWSVMERCGYRGTDVAVMSKSLAAQARSDLQQA